MATITTRNYGIANGQGGRILHVREADSQTFVVGDPVYLSGGYVTALASDAGDYLGIAMKSATNVVAAWATIPVWVPGSNSTVWMQIINNVTAAAASATYRGEDYANTVATYNYIDYSDNSGTLGTIINKHPNDEWADTNCRCQCSIVPAVSQFHSGT